MKNKVQGRDCGFTGGISVDIGSVGQQDRYISVSYYDIHVKERCLERTTYNI
jgi:hypothetical protein